LHSSRNTNTARGGKFVDDKTKVRRAQFAQTLPISHPIGTLTVCGEIWHFSQPLTHSYAVGNLWSTSYSVRKNLVIDAGFDHGLTRTSTQWEGLCWFHLPPASTTLAPEKMKSSWRVAQFMRVLSVLETICGSPFGPPAMNGFRMVVPKKDSTIKGAVTFVTMLSFRLLRHFVISWGRLDAFLVVAPGRSALRELPRAVRNGR
jgi:hypothetical protein